MSLLMDALKRAQEANQQGPDTASTAESAWLALEPVDGPARGPAAPPGEPATGALPELPKLEDLDDEFIAHVKQPPLRSKPPTDRATLTGTTPPRLPPQPSVTPVPRQGGREETGERDAIRNAFAVKEPAKRSRALALIVGGTTALAVGAIGLYFWLQLQPRHGQGITALQPVASAPAPSPRTVAPTPSMPPIPAAEEPDGEPPAVAEAAPARKPSPSTPFAATGARRPAQAPTAPTASSLDGLPIRFAKSNPKTEPVANEAYAALQAGNIATAKAAYRRLLEQDPRNIDALQGVAAIALRENRNEDAETAYLRILEQDPRDAAAHAGLVGLRNQGDPVLNESRIKTLMAAQPDLPVLNFALGNIYARQNRWSEAQQAYFKAYGADTENPDYLFNLAVSLDQLHQPKLAIQYYGQALKAAEHRPAAFDPAQLTARLRELQR